MKKLPFYINSPVVLGLTFIALLITAPDILFHTKLQRFFGCSFSSWLDPLMYMRLFTHVFPHADFAHYTANFMFILAVGPMVEEKYGGKPLTVMIAVTAGITGLANILFFRHVLLIGASGIVFMLILLASFVNIRQGKIPVTVLLVGVLFIGNEIVAGLSTHDSTSQISHIIGGLCGAGFGYLQHFSRLKRDYAK